MGSSVCPVLFSSSVASKGKISRIKLYGSMMGRRRKAQGPNGGQEVGIKSIAQRGGAPDDEKR